MKEIRNDIWKYYGKKNVAIVITTNGAYKYNNDIVAGAGVAREAKDRIPNFTKLVGLQVAAWGNHVYHIKTGVFSFPVKKHWSTKARYDLIEQSCIELVKMLKQYKYKKIIVPRPGCGNGRLPWRKVKPILEKYFDDRFYVIRK